MSNLNIILLNIVKCWEFFQLELYGCGYGTRTITFKCKVRDFCPQFPVRFQYFLGRFFPPSWWISHPAHNRKVIFIVKFRIQAKHFSRLIQSLIWKLVDYLNLLTPPPIITLITIIWKGFSYHKISDWC